MAVRGKTNAQGRKGQSGTASASNLKARGSTARRGRTLHGKTSGGLAERTGRGKQRNVK